MDTLIASFQTLIVDPATPKFTYMQQQQQQQQQQHPLQQTNNTLCTTGTSASFNIGVNNTLCTWIGCNHGSSMDVDDVFCPRRSERLAVKTPINYKGLCK